MKPAVLGGLLGALAGFFAVLAVNMFTFFSPTVSALLFPGRIFIKYSNGMGMFGHMVFDTFAYFGNLLLYAAVGYGIGSLFSNRTSV